ncbi:MAG: glycosyltransferase [Luteolibacter sp.]
MISVVIPSFNRRDCVLRLLKDVYAQQEVDFEVIVVDDSSADDTVTAVCREFPQVTMLVNKSNGGPCVARNRGICAASGEIIIGFDSDVTISDHRLLVKIRDAFVESTTASGFAFRLLMPDGVTDDAPRWWHPVSLEEGKGTHFETDYFSGTGYAFRRHAMIGAGLFPEILYMHYEEVELAHRIIDNGGSIIYRPEFSVLHHANEVSRRSEIQVFYKPRNQILLVLSYYPIWGGICYLVPRVIFQFVKALKYGHVKDFCRAMNDALRKSRLLLPVRKPLKRDTLQKIRRLRNRSGV